MSTCVDRHSQLRKACLTASKLRRTPSWQASSSANSREPTPRRSSAGWLLDNLELFPLVLKPPSIPLARARQTPMDPSQLGLSWSTSLRILGLGTLVRVQLQPPQPHLPLLPNPLLPQLRSRIQLQPCRLPPQLALVGSNSRTARMLKRSTLNSPLSLHSLPAMVRPSSFTVYLLLLIFHENITDGEQACINSGFAQCVGGKFVVTPCGATLTCSALPLVNKAGTSITCTTAADAAARIKATGA